jgi:hypothetical protein
MSIETLQLDALNLVAGAKIGSGLSRTVYECRILPNCVVKCEDSEDYFQNVLEWQIWQRVKEWPAAARWFAPCRFISPDGKLLIMERTIEPRAKDYPTKMPVFLTDFKRTNYGMIGGKLVCHDYGVSLVMEHGFYSKVMRRADWWDCD